MNGIYLRDIARRVPGLCHMVALSAAILMSMIGSAHATHERAASISWNAAGGNTVEFSVQSSWRRSGYATCRNPNSPTLASMACTGPGGGPGVGDLILETVANTRLNFGDGSDVGSPGAGGGLAYVVTAIDVANDWLFAEAIDPGELPGIDESISHTYASDATRTAFIEDCCRISASSGNNRHINNPDGDYRIETIVNPAGGNSPPTSAMPPIVLCPRSGICTFAVPAADPDDDTITFRLSTDTEAAGAGNTFNQPGEADPSSNATINAMTGVYTWNTAGATLGPISANTYYSTQITVEDRDGSNNVKSKIAVDFLIQLVDQAGVVPVFEDPTCGATIDVNPGDPVSFSVEASDADFGQTVTLNVAGLPIGATMTPGLPTSGNPVSSVFSWTPTVGHTGAHVLNFSATDNAGLQSFCAVTIQVASCQSNADCTDADLCTNDVCDPGNPSSDLGGCVHPAVVCDACQTCDSMLGCTGAVCTATPTETQPTETPTETPTDTPTMVAPPTAVPTATATPTASPTTSTPPIGGCGVTPETGCRTAHRALLLIRNNINNEKDKLIWKWIKGAATSLEEFGEPNGSTQFTMCIYSGGNSAVAAIPSGSSWVPRGTKGFKYKDLSASLNGVRKALLKSGVDGKAKVLVKGKGLNLPDTLPPPLQLPVLVQLVNSANGVCYESVFGEGDVKKNDEKRFKAKSTVP